MKKLFKKVITFSMTIAMVTTNVFAKDIIINGFKQYKDIEIINDMELMKHDTLLNAMGVYYNFDVDNQRVIIVHNDKEIIITRGSKIAMVDGKEVDMGIIPTIGENKSYNESLYIPIEFVANELGAVVGKNDEKIQIAIDTLTIVEPNLYGVTDETIKYSYDEAVQKAIKNTNDIKEIQNSTDSYEYSKEMTELGKSSYELAGLMGQSLGNNYIDAISTVRMLDELIDMEDEQIKLTEEKLEYNVLSSLINLETTKDSINILETNINILEQTFNNNIILNELGMLSDKELSESKKALEDAKSSLEMLKLNLDTSKYNLNNAMGVSLNEDNYIDFNANIEPLDLDIDVYAKHSAHNSLTVEQLRASQEKAKYDYNNYLGNGELYYQEGKDEKLRASQNTAMQIGDIITAHELAIKQLYISAEQVLKNHNTLVSDYEKSIEDYNTAVLNYDLGYITQLQVDYAKMNVQSKFNLVRENVLNYENLKYMILNPDLILAQ